MTRHALVTGTSSGIGTAIARALLERGWQVHGLARREAPIDHPAYRHHRLDLDDLPALEEWADGVLAPALAGAQHLALVNNAAVLEPLTSTDRLPAAELDRAFRVNVSAPMWLAGRCLRLPLERLRVVNVSSGAATSAYPGWAAYCSTKAALRMASEVLALEVLEVPALQGRDVRVLSWAPHVVRTEMQERIRAADPAAFPRRARFEELDREDRLVPPEDPAAELAALLDADELEPYGERRYSPPA